MAHYYDGWPSGASSPQTRLGFVTDHPKGRTTTKGDFPRMPATADGLSPSGHLRGFEGGVGFEAAEVAATTSSSSSSGMHLRRHDDHKQQPPPLLSEYSTGRLYAPPHRQQVIADPFGTSSVASKQPAPIATTSFAGGTLDDNRLLGHLGDAQLPKAEVPRSVDEFEDELPLLEELGIHPDHITKRIKAALLFYKPDHDLVVDVDMCGPLLIAACLGCCLLLRGKIHFGYIYGLSVCGCLCMCLLLNLMSQEETIDVYRTISILGYGLLPVVGLAAVAIAFPLRNSVGFLLSSLCVAWCTATASRFFETALQMHHQRFLVAYPVALIYASFVLITVF